eukprot:TRINITY_DN11136_c0_g1_i1.p1 TRINITY_DN11136_c0_g1~~TRINITY_DN11136_c0_g1_i1.p1  ORF type:complete len:184 (+),score=29.21 TRINITY_DN11136_c0_g1_i1:64-615(+)
MMRKSGSLRRMLASDHSQDVSYGAPRRAPMDVTFAITDSAQRAKLSRSRAVASRKQNVALSYLNYELDKELEQLRRDLVCKRGVLKIQSTPPLRVAERGSLVNADGTDSTESGNKTSQNSRCTVCQEELLQGQLVRRMFMCCGEVQHAACIQDLLQRETSCPSCNKLILTQREIKELDEPLRA